jgi:hypothetical protein
MKKIVETVCTPRQLATLQYSLCVSDSARAFTGAGRPEGVYRDVERSVSQLTKS